MRQERTRLDPFFLYFLFCLQLDGRAEQWINDGGVVVYWVEMGYCFEVDGGAAIEREKELTAALHQEILGSFLLIAAFEINCGMGMKRHGL